VYFLALSTVSDALTAKLQEGITELKAELVKVQSSHLLGLTHYSDMFACPSFLRQIAAAKNSGDVSEGRLEEVRKLLMVELVFK
jgi:hypothetical protein